MNGVGLHEKRPVSVGPWGGQEGGRWDDGAHSTVRQIVISHGAGIDSIQFEYDEKGASIESVKHGGNGGLKTDKIKLITPDEYLISINGYYGSINNWGPVFVRSLAFQSNKRMYGPFGVQQGTHFSFSMEGGKIVGFHGNSSWYLDSIGLYLKPARQDRNKTNTIVTSQSFVASGTDKVGYNVVQGSVGKGYDIVLAVRQKEDYNKVSPNISRQSSHTSDEEDESKNKQLSLPSNSMKTTMSREDKDAVSYGPWGGSGGSVFDDGVYTGIRQINLTRTTAITSIKVHYDRNGKGIWGNKTGGTGAIRSDKIIIDYPYEVLTHITGYYGPLIYMGPTVIKSLTFHTTKKKYGPYGDELGTPFASNLKEGMIVGFFGRRGWFIDSIGVHVLEGKVSTPTPPTHNTSIDLTSLPVSEVDNPQWSNKLVLAKPGPNEEVSYGVMKEPAPCEPGPWGGDGGKPWDDGVFTGIKQIYLTRGEAISSLQIEYDRNGQSVWSTRHGGSGISTNKIKFDYPHEVVICISGYYGPVNKNDGVKAIKSLTFYTSRGKYGPFGEEIGTFFTSTTTEGKVVGFHGRSSLYLHAIGVHMQHWLGSDRRGRSFFSKMFG